MFKIFNNKSFFKISYVLLLTINFLPIVNIMPFTRVLLAFFALWGVYLFFRDISIQKISFFKNGIKSVILLLFVVFAFTYLINFKNDGLYNIVSLGFYFLSAFFLFDNTDNKINEKELVIISNGYIIIGFIAAFVSDIMFLFQVHLPIQNRAGSQVHLGVFENRLFGLFSSPNVGCTFILLGMLMSFVVLWLKKNQASKGLKIFYCIFYFFGLVYYSLSLSKGAFVCLTASVIVFFIFTKLPGFLNKNSSVIKSLFIRAVAIAVSLVVISFGVDFIRFFMVKSSNFVYLNIVNNYNNIDGQNNDPEFNEIVLERIEADSDDISNKRFSIWKASFNSMKGKYIFGIGDTVSNLDNVKNELSKDDVAMIEYSHGNIHNGYLQIFIECGIIALLLYIGMLIWFVFRSLKALYEHRKNNHTYQLLLLLLAIPFYILLNNCFETNMALMGANVFQAVLWLFSGYAVTLFRRNTEN